MAGKRKIRTMREQVYHILREEICRGEYPPGMRLQEADLVEHLNVSRSPVREALRQLVADNLLVEIPNKGVYIREFTAKDIDEIYDLRVMLESYGIFNSEGKVTSARKSRLLRILKELETTFGGGDIEAYTEADEKLHMEIVRLADNSLINDTYERVRAMNQQFRVLSLMDADRFRESLEEHQQIIQGIVDGDPSAADAVNRQHLEKAREAIRKGMTRLEE